MTSNRPRSGSRSRSRSRSGEECRRPLLDDHDPTAVDNDEIPHWPRNRELGWLFPYGLKYPPPVLPNSLRGLQADLDSAWMELERQHVIVNRINLLTSTLALLITSSGGLTTAMANTKHGPIWSTIMGTLTTLSGTVMGGIRAIGQPRRAENRVRRLERIIDHIARLYYSTGSTTNGHAEDSDRAVEEAWKMIDEEEAQTEREEQQAGHFAYASPTTPTKIPASSALPSILPPSSSKVGNRIGSISNHEGDDDLVEQQIGQVRRIRRSNSKLLGDINIVRTRSTTR